MSEKSYKVIDDFVIIDVSKIELSDLEEIPELENMNYWYTSNVSSFFPPTKYGLRIYLGDKLCTLSAGDYLAYRIGEGMGGAIKPTPLGVGYMDPSQLTMNKERR